jgi:hypothetical protein
MQRFFLFYSCATLSLPSPSIHSIKQAITYILLETLPKAYKKEAKFIFSESCEPTDIKEAFDYFEGGGQYRLRRIQNKLKAFPINVYRRVNITGKTLFQALKRQMFRFGGSLNSQTLYVERKRYLRPLFSGGNPLFTDEFRECTTIKQQ